MLSFVGLHIKISGIEQFQKGNILSQYLVEDEEKYDFELDLMFVDCFDFIYLNEYEKPMLEGENGDIEYRAYYEYGYLVAVNELDVSHQKMTILMKREEEKKSLDFILPYLAFEKLLWLNKRFILHSSSIQYQGKAIAFIGDSGVGKSTQASLWQQYEDVQMIAGDRSGIYLNGSEVYICGIPFDGSAHCFTNFVSPLVGVVVLKQGQEEVLERLNVREAFKEVYSQMTINTWNEKFNKDVIDFCFQVITQIPVYRLTCRISKNAVDVVRRELFGE